MPAVARLLLLPISIDNIMYVILTLYLSRTLQCVLCLDRDWLAGTKCCWRLARCNCRSAAALHWTCHVVCSQKPAIRVFVQTTFW